MKKPTTTKYLMFTIFSLGIFLLLFTGFKVFNQPENKLGKDQRSQTSLKLAVGEKPKETTATSTSTTTSSSETTTSSDPRFKLMNQLPKESKTSDWNLVLVNQDHPITTEPDDLVTFNNVSVSSKIKDPLNEMFQGALKDGITLEMVSGYRSVSYQQTLFQKSINDALAKGMTEEEAKTEALRFRTEPGTSEHHTGLCADIYDADWSNKNGTLVGDYGNEPGGQWLKNNCATYGFIIRYPEGKTAETHIEYEPWHLRYVGVENAKFITENNLCLESFINLLQQREEN